MRYLYLIKKEKKFMFRTSFNHDDFQDEKVLDFWEVPENMNFDSGRFPCDIRNLIDMQIMSIKQGETAIRRLPLRRKILNKLNGLKVTLESSQ